MPRSFQGWNPRPVAFSPVGREFRAHPTQPGIALDGHEELRRVSPKPSYTGLMKMAFVLALLLGCAGGKVRHAPREAPMDEAATYGPSHTIYLR